MRKIYIEVLILIVALAVPSYAAYFTGGTAAAESKTSFGPREIVANPPSLIVDGSGFTSGNNWDGTVSTALTAQWYNSYDQETAANDKRGPEGTWVRVQLARTVDNPDRTVTTLRQIRIWNLNAGVEWAARARMKDINISSYDIGTNTWTDLGDYTLDFDDYVEGSSYDGQIIDIPDIAYPYYIKITCINRYDPEYFRSPVSVAEWVGLAEVRFDGDLIDAWCDAGADQEETLANASTTGVSLGGSVSGAGAGSVLWTKVSGPGTVVFTGGATNASTTATFTAAGSYVLALTEANSGFADQVVVRVTDGTAVTSSSYPFLIGYWPLDGNVDDSINSNNGTVTGSPDYVDGMVGAAMAFDGVDDGVVISNSSFFDQVINVSPQMTVTFWAKTAYGANPYGHAISKIRWDESNFRGAGWAVFGLTEKAGANDLLAYVSRHDNDPFYDFLYAPAGGPTDDGVWHHYAMVIDYTASVNGADVRFYRDASGSGATNGVDVDVQSISSVGEALTFGFAESFETGYYWKGQLDEVRIFDKALSASEIGQLLTADGGACTPGAGDVNNDCDVDMNDFALLAADWISCTNYYQLDCFN